MWYFFKGSLKLYVRCWVFPIIFCRSIRIYSINVMKLLIFLSQILSNTFYLAVLFSLIIKRFIIYNYFQTLFLTVQLRDTEKGFAINKEFWLNFDIVDCSEGTMLHKVMQCVNLVLRLYYCSVPSKPILFLASKSIHHKNWWFYKTIFYQIFLIKSKMFSIKKNKFWLKIWFSHLKCFLTKKCN